LLEWIAKMKRSRIEPRKKVARMPERHADLILNWHIATGTMSSGVVEA
jgi:hypothetical protein